MLVNLQHLQHAENATKTEKRIFNRLVRCQEFKIISIRLEIRNQHVKMHQIPSMEEKSATSSAKPVSLVDVDYRVRKVAYFSIFLNLELLFCETIDFKEPAFLVCEPI